MKKEVDQPRLACERGINQKKNLREKTLIPHLKTSERKGHHYNKDPKGLKIKRDIKKVVRETIPACLADLPFALPY